ncbi:hypothetical protein [Rhodopila sp.]|uniref:hypothetical protein n=1 Tax=Rhodopila sp. TaxID=2480087 RepID=UPI003D1380FC
MFNPDPQPEPDLSTVDVILQTILGFMLPFLLAGAGGNPDLAIATIMDLVNDYQAATPQELELVGRIISFSTLSMDNLRLSMTEGLADSKVLRYRSNAVALSRNAEQCRKVLQDIQGNRRPGVKPLIMPVYAPRTAQTRTPTIPAPLAAATTPAGSMPDPVPAAKASAPQARSSKPDTARPCAPASHARETNWGDGALEQMKREASGMIQALQDGGEMPVLTQMLAPAPAAGAHVAVGAGGFPPTQAATIPIRLAAR